MQSICVVIPAYQPDHRLAELVATLPCPVVVVDDGSGDAYALVFRAVRDLGATVLCHAENRGKGAALKTAFSHVLQGLPCAGVVTADADGQHSAADIVRVAERLLECPAHMIIGRRNFARMPFRSRFGNTLSRLGFRLGTGLRISDTQTGLRGLPHGLLERLLEVPGERYEYEMNVLLALPRWKIPYAELPIATIYIDKNRSSHFRPLRDGARVYSRLILYSLSSLLCAALDYGLYMAFQLLWNPGLSYAAARLLSAGANYYLNCRVVFRKRNTLRNAAQYAALASANMLLGALGTWFLSANHINSLLAKLLLDTLLFILNYLVQRRWIFAEKA